MVHDNLNEFERVAIARDLVRKPDIRFLAGVLYTLATGDVDKSDIPPVYTMIAWRLITKPHAKDIFKQALETVS